MQTPPTEPVFIQKLRKYLRSIQSREGDRGVRQTLLAERLVTSNDQQMTPKDHREVLAALDQIETEPLPNK